MAETNQVGSVFASKAQNAMGSSFSRVRANREYLISDEVATDLNTYVGFEKFAIWNDTYARQYNKKDDDPDCSEWTNGVFNQGEAPLKLQGVRSIFNKYAAVPLDSASADQVGHLRASTNTPLLDSQKTRQTIRDMSRCTVKDLVQASQSGLLGRNQYSYADFMYCKHLGRIPNNYLITLRRFPFPVDDYISTMGIDSNTKKNDNVTSKNAQSIGCMVTWLGTPGNEMENILKYTISMPYTEQQQQEQSVSGGDGDKEGGVLNKIAALTDRTYRDQYARGYAGDQVNGWMTKIFGEGNVGKHPYSMSSLANYRDTRNKVWGGADTIRSIYKRGSDGLKFGQTFQLTFDYELRSYNGINTRQAMLDLLTNILATTYTTGDWWGGGYTGGVAHQNNVFANLKIFNLPAGKSGFSDYLDAFSEDVNTVGSAIKFDIKAAGGLWNAIKSALNSLGGMFLGGKLNQLGRPDKAYAAALLTSEPTGLWHVTIGNPFHPIMSMGNMVLKNTTIEHYGPLGLDDFPTGLKVTCELERGKPRDQRDIERIYMGGQERIFYSMNDKVKDMYDSATPYKNKMAAIQGKEKSEFGAKFDEYAAEAYAVAEKYAKDLKAWGNDVYKKWFGCETPDEHKAVTYAAEEMEFGTAKKPLVKVSKMLEDAKKK